MRGTDNVQGQYWRIFSPQMEAIMFIILQISFAMRAVLKILSSQLLLSNIQSHDVFRPIAREQKDLMDYMKCYLHACAQADCVPAISQTDLFLV